MFSFNPRNLLIIVSCLIVIQMVNSSCEEYNLLDWGNTDVNFQRIDGLYSVITTNVRAIFGSCEVHGLTQKENGAMLDRFKNGSPCPTVYQNRITKTTNAFQFEFFGDDINCIVPGASVGDMKMKVLPNGECFFKAFCLTDGTSVINLLCRNPDTSGLTMLLSPIVNLVLNLLGDSLFKVDQSCYKRIVNNQTELDQLLGP